MMIDAILDAKAGFVEAFGYQPDTIHITDCQLAEVKNTPGVLQLIDQKCVEGLNFTYIAGMRVVRSETGIHLSCGQKSIKVNDE